MSPVQYGGSNDFERGQAVARATQPSHAQHRLEATLESRSVSAVRAAGPELSNT